MSNLKNDGGSAKAFIRSLGRTNSKPRRRGKRSKPSEAEDQMALQLDGMKLPYERQYAYIPGRKFRADFALVEHRLLIEIQGGVFTGQAHGSVTGVLADIERLNQATVAGYRVLRFTPAQVTSGEARETIERVLG